MTSKKMTSVWKCVAWGILTASVLLGAASNAQQSSTDEGQRKVKTRVAAVYPDLARRMNVGGKVKIEVVITPDGRVRSTKVIGGHPLLVQAAQTAVKDWKFYPGPDETTQIIEFDFQPVS